MADEASGNTGLPSGVASMGSGGAMTIESVERLAAKSSEPSITGVSDDAPISLDDPESAPQAPAQDVGSTPATETETTTEEAAPGFDLPPEPEQKQQDLAPVPTQETPAPQNGARNYADYPEELHPILKSLNNANFAAKAPVLKQMHEKAKRADTLESELAEARKGPQFFYEHPEGYQLDPQFRDARHELDLCEFEAEHWRNQLVAIKSGAAWVNIKGYKRDARGRPVEPIFEQVQSPGEGKIDTAAEVQVMGHLQNVAPVRQNVLGRLQGIVNEYSNSGQRAQSELAEIDKRIFSKFGELDKLPPDEKKHYELATSAVPKYFRNHPLTDKLGKSFVMYNRLLARTLTAYKEIDRLKAEISGRSRANPTKIPAGGGNGKVAAQDEMIKYDEL